MEPQLTPEQIARLVPLLHSLARLVAAGRAVSDEQLELLLIGAGLNEHPAALAEIRRWTRLLQSAADTTDPGVKQTVVEGLILRGLPGDAALRALDTVAARPASIAQPVSKPAPGKEDHMPPQDSPVPGSPGHGSHQGGQNNPTNVSFDNIRSTAGNYLQPASVEPSSLELTAIRVLKIFGWVDLVLSIVVALCFCGFTALTSNQVSQFSGGIAGVQLMTGLLISVVVVLQGLFAWAVCQAIASITESLIMIRRNTARG